MESYLKVRFQSVKVSTIIQTFKKLKSMKFTWILFLLDI